MDLFHTGFVFGYLYQKDLLLNGFKLMIVPEKNGSTTIWIRIHQDCARKVEKLTIMVRISSGLCPVNRRKLSIKERIHRELCLVKVGSF